MKIFLLLVGLWLTGSAISQCDYVKHFEILINRAMVFNTLSPDSGTLYMDDDTLEDTDLFQVKFRECDQSPVSHYELHLVVPELGKDHTFINDLPEFAMNIAWFTQYHHRKMEIFMYFFDKRYLKDNKEKMVMKVAEILIS